MAQLLSNGRLWNISCMSAAVHSREVNQLWYVIRIILSCTKMATLCKIKKLLQKYEIACSNNDKRKVIRLSLYEILCLMSSYQFISYFSYCL